MNNMLKTPVLFLVFNRPDTTVQVFKSIKKQKPKYLYIAADGPRKNKTGEKEKCLAVRRIVEQIDWDCEVKTLFREENSGCKIAVSSAITWFFEQVEYGIILEDDCLPDDSFFPFCEELLIKYKDDDRIGHIGGNCFFPDIISEDLSYDFCYSVHIWGWASWARVWKNYDVNFPFWEVEKNDIKKRDSIFHSYKEKIYFTSFISDALSGKKGINTWDIQYSFMLRIQNQLSIYPRVNLVSNIGFNTQDATHSQNKNNVNLDVFNIESPLRHPKYFLSNKKIMNKTMSEIFFSWKRLIRYFLKLY